MPLTDRKGRSPLQPREALSAGLRNWVGLMLVSAAGLIVIFATQMNSHRSPSAPRVAGWVFVGLSVGWLVLPGSAVLILRSYCFRALWDGRPVEPGSYLKGMYQVWGVLVAGGLLAVLGSLLMGAILPGGLVVLVSLVLLIFARPNGRALGL